MSKTSIPIFWANQFWVEQDGILKPSGKLPPDHPERIDYSIVNWDSRSLLESIHPEQKYRTLLHQQILEKQLSMAPLPKEGESPRCILTHGGIASGKTSSIESFFGFKKKSRSKTFSYLHIDFDRIKTQLPEYAYMQTIKLHEHAAPFVQSESAKLAATLLKKAIKQKINVIYEGSLEDITLIDERIREMRKRDYKILLISSYVPEPVGQRRAKRRFKRGGRFVPEDRVAETYRNCPKTLCKLIGLVDNVILFDNKIETKSANRPMVIVEGGEIKELKSLLYSQYIKDVGIENDFVSKVLATQA